MNFPFLSRMRNRLVPDSGHEFITVVSGLPRSGTSMMMKMLAAGGLDALTDALRKADASNPKGYFEFERVKKLKDGDREWVDDARGKAVKVISALLHQLPTNYSYKVIFMRRYLHEVLSSQKAMLERNGEQGGNVSDEELAALYRKHLSDVEVWLAHQPHLEVLFVSYNDLLTEPESYLKRVVDFLEVPLDLEAMIQVVDPNLYRQRKLATGK